MIIQHQRHFRDHLLLFVLVLLSGYSVIIPSKAQETLFDGCDIQDYYKEFITSDSDSRSLQDTVSREALELLLESTHRKVLPYTDSDKDDVWKALMDLDEGSTDDTVHLIYRQVDFPALPHGTPDTWNREHLWPKSLGVGYTGECFLSLLLCIHWDDSSAKSGGRRQAWISYFSHWLLYWLTS